MIRPARPVIVQSVDQGLRCVCRQCQSPRSERAEGVGGLYDSSAAVVEEEEAALHPLPTMLEGITAAIADYRASVTAPDVILLAACLSIWSAVYYESVLSPRGSPNGFDKSTFISNLHSVPLCVLAALSIAELIPEAVPVCWSVGFFAVDLVDCVTRRDLMWTFHAVISLVLNVATGFVPRHVVLRSRSRGFLTEASTVRF